MRLQSFVLARLADFCDWRVRKPQEADDPLPYLTAKLREIEPPLYTLKQQLYDDALADFLVRAEAGRIDEKALEDFCFLLERYLSPCDFVDAVYDLTLERLSTLEGRTRLRQGLKHLCVHRMLDEEQLPPEKRRPSWERMVKEFYARLDFVTLYRIAERRKLTPRRLSAVLRRLQRNVGEYCSVLHHPRGPEDAFTPFMTPRIEGLVAACNRLVALLRTLPR